MRILALDLGKFKTVACEYEAETERHRFATVATTPKALHDLMVDLRLQNAHKDGVDAATLGVIFDDRRGVDAAFHFSNSAR